MRYEIGDKVKIKSDLSKCENIDPSGCMRRWEGQIMTISCILRNSSTLEYYYKLSEDSEKWNWYADMFEGLVDKVDFTYEEILRKNIKEAFQKAKEEWNEQNVEVQIVYGCHYIGGKVYTWQNPDKMPVQSGHIIKVETVRGETPVIVLEKKIVPKMEADKYKKVVGVYI